MHSEGNIDVGDLEQPLNLPEVDKPTIVSNTELRNQVRALKLGLGSQAFHSAFTVLGAQAMLCRRGPKTCLMKTSRDARAQVHGLGCWGMGLGCQVLCSVFDSSFRTLALAGFGYLSQGCQGSSAKESQNVE